MKHKIQFRAKLPNNVLGTKDVYYTQGNQFIASFLRRAKMLVSSGELDEDEHEKYLPKSLEDYLEVKIDDGEWLELTF